MVYVASQSTIICVKKSYLIILFNCAFNILIKTVLSDNFTLTCNV